MHYVKNTPSDRKTGELKHAKLITNNEKQSVLAVDNSVWLTL